jgi:hypothetical protein
VEPSQLETSGGVLITTGTERSLGGNLMCRLAWLRDVPHPQSIAAQLGVWLSDACEYGRVLEICVPVDMNVDVQPGLELAAALRATPLISRGQSLFASFSRINGVLPGPLSDERLLAMSLTAVRAFSDGAIADTGIADSAAVLAGFFPAYTGGPFTYLRQCGVAAVRARAHAGSPTGGEELFALPSGIEQILGTSVTAND